MQKQDTDEDESYSIMSSPVLVVLDARIKQGKLFIRVSVNGETQIMPLALDCDGLQLVKLFESKLQSHLVKSVERLFLTLPKSPKTQDERKRAKFNSARIGFIKRCLDQISEIRKRDASVVTQREVAELLYGPPRRGGADRDARFSQDLRRKKISFSRLCIAGKRWEELTRDELIEVLSET